MGEKQSKPEDDGPISIRNGPKNTNVAECDQDNATFKQVPPMKLCAMDCALAAPVFAQCQDILWSYDDIVHENQMFIHHLSKRVNKLSSTPISTSLPLGTTVASFTDVEASLSHVSTQINALESDVASLNRIIERLEQCETDETSIVESP
jgi:hypothetical protein